jgi:hypothetical protein
MKTSKRFDRAINKLYNAFHNNTLIPGCCKQCAVGNILDQRDYWKHLSDEHGSLHLNYIGLVNENFGKRFNGYLPSELLLIEATFLKACGYALPLHYKNKKPTNATSKDTLFKGLESVVSLLCQLDSLENIMDCTKLFNYKIKQHNLLLASN